MNQDTLIFLHIPKTAGTTINNILENNFPANSRFYINPSDTKESRAKLISMSDESKYDIRLLYGHMGFGWHNLLPTKCNYITFLRDPVERVVSHYNYVRFRLDHKHYLREIVEREKMGISEYVSSGVCDELNNGQVRLLTGIEDCLQVPYGKSEFEYGFNNREYLDLVLSNFRGHFAFVGIQAAFDKSLVLLKHKHQLLNNIKYKAKNVGTKRYAMINPTEGDLAIIRKLNSLDIELYNLTRTRFETEWRSLSYRNIWLRYLRFVNK